MLQLDYVISLLGSDIKSAISVLDEGILSRLSEIRIRKNGYLVLMLRNAAYFISADGEISERPQYNSIITTGEYMDKLYLKLCEYSVYSNTENIKRGFITLRNGARVGLSGTAVTNGGEIVSVKDISSLNIRIPREVRGCSNNVLNFLYVNSFPSVIVAGMPASGKTTLLRDMAYQLSSGYNERYRKVALVDERCELAGRGFGDGAFCRGINCDVLSSFPKAKGIELATRTLSPDMIICDEVSQKAEVEAIAEAFSSGISFALSVHIGSREDLYKKPVIRQLIDTGEFSYIVLLRGTTYKAEVIDVEEVKGEISRLCGNSCGDSDYGLCRV